MGWINVLSFSSWIYTEEIFRKDLKQTEKNPLEIWLYLKELQKHLWNGKMVKVFYKSCNKFLCCYLARV